MVLIVGSGILYIVTHAQSHKETLSSILEPLLKQLTLEAWSVLDASSLKIHRKPIWFQSLCDLLEPIFLPVLDTLIDDLESGANLSQIPEAISQMNKNILDLTSIIPLTFYQLCELIESLLPHDIRPTCDSVIVHFFFSCIISMIHKLIPVLRSIKIDSEKIDFLEVFSEKIIQMESSPELQRMEGLTDSSNHLKESFSHQWNSSSEDFLDSLSSMVGKTISLESNGRFALRAIHRFVSYNCDWIQSTLGISILSNIRTSYQKENVKLRPWNFKIFKVSSPYESMNFINLEPISILSSTPLSWEDILRFLPKDPTMVLQFLYQRIENRLCQNESESKTYKALLSHFEKIIEENHKF